MIDTDRIRNLITTPGGIYRKKAPLTDPNKIGRICLDLCIEIDTLRKEAAQLEAQHQSLINEHKSTFDTMIR